MVYSKLDADAIHVDDNTRIQILDSIYHLSGADKEQCGAFIVSTIPHIGDMHQHIFSL